MTVKELRYLIDNLDEYIHVPGGIERLKKTVLHLAVSGKLVPQAPNEGTGEELYKQIQAEKQKLIAEGSIRKQKSLPPITDGELPFIIPESWKWVRLGDIGTVGTGATPQRDNQLYYGGTIPWVTSALTSQDIILTTDEYITKKAISETNCSVYPTGSLVIAMYGQGKTRGQVATLGIDAATNQACAVFVKISESGLHTEYVRKVIEACYETMRRGAAGGAQPNLNIQKVKELVAPLPPAGEQVRIIDKVNAIFTLIDQLSEKYQVEQAERQKLIMSSLSHMSRGKGDPALQILSEIIRTKADAVQLRKTILHLAVSGQLVSQIPTEATSEDLHAKLRLVNTSKKKSYALAENEIPFGIPTSWKWVKLNDVGQIIGGGTPSSSNMKYYTEDHETGIAWLTPADLRGYMDVFISRGAKSITEVGLKNSSARLLPKGTVLFSSRAPIGHIAIASNELSTNQGFKSVVPYGNMNSEYIYRWLQYYAPTIDANASGTTFREVSGAIVAEQPIPLPPLAEQRRIVQKVTQLLGLVRSFELILEGKQLVAPIIERVEQPQWFAIKQGIGAVLERLAQTPYERGEMVIAKYMYLMQEIYKVPLGLQFVKHQFGPYDPNIKKAILSSAFQKDKFFKVKGSGDKQVYSLGEKSDTLMGYSSDALFGMRNGLRDLMRYTGKAKSSDIERLATVCKIIQDSQSDHEQVVINEMKKWKNDKFTPEEVKKSLSFIRRQGWHEKLLK